MPTILRFRSFRIVIFTDDHVPAHVHAIGPDCAAIYNLDCWNGEIALRSNDAVKPVDLRALADFLELNQNALCWAWEKIHGH